MPGFMPALLFTACVCAFGAAALGFMARRAYTGRWRGFLTLQPVLVPVGRYWGLLTCALWSVCCAWVGVAGSYILWAGWRYGDMSPTQTFMLICPVLVIVGGAGLLFSWWLPPRWRPRWLLDQDRTPGQRPAEEGWLDG